LEKETAREAGGESERSSTPPRGPEGEGSGTVRELHETESERRREATRELSRPRIYLAGPEVFLPNAREIGEAKRRLCSERGATGLFPLDEEVPDAGSLAARADAIFRKNVELMDGADAVIANMSPFRGIGMDGGTAFEMGYMHARGKLVLGYTNAAGSYLRRAIEAGIARRHTSGGVEVARAAGVAEAEGVAEEEFAVQVIAFEDEVGLRIESFGLADNLMMVCAVRARGLDVLVEERRKAPGSALDWDPSLFARCVDIAVAEVRKLRGRPQSS